MTEKNSMGIQLVLFGAKFLSRYTVRVHDWHNDGVFIKATKSFKIVVLTCYLSHSPKIHR